LSLLVPAQLIALICLQDDVLCVEWDGIIMNEYD